MQSHLREMEQDLRSVGYAGEILISTSAGGCMHVAEISREADSYIEVGPSDGSCGRSFLCKSRSIKSEYYSFATLGARLSMLAWFEMAISSHTRDTWLGARWVGETD